MKIDHVWFLFVLFLFLVYSGVEVLAQNQEKVYAIWGDPIEGRRVYAEKGCGRCHAINGSVPPLDRILAKPLRRP